MPSNDLLWPTFRGPADPAEIERVPLEERGLPASTYELVTRAACLWPDRQAVSVPADPKPAPRRLGGDGLTALAKAPGGYVHAS
jgi:hypothetical protein